MPTFTIHAQGTKLAAIRFERMGAAVTHAEPAFETIADLMMEIWSAIFSGQGRRFGGSWKSDTPEWLARKVKNGLDPRINHATLALRRSLTVRGDENQILEVMPQSLSVGSTLDYAAAVNEVRPYMDFVYTDRLKMRKIMGAYLVSAWKGAHV